MSGERTIAGDLLLEPVSTAYGLKLRVASLRTVVRERLLGHGDGGVTLDTDEVAELREACDEFLTRGRV